MSQLTVPCTDPAGYIPALHVWSPIIKQKANMSVATSQLISIVEHMMAIVKSPEELTAKIQLLRAAVDSSAGIIFGTMVKVPDVSFKLGMACVSLLRDPSSPREGMRITIRGA